MNSWCRSSQAHTHLCVAPLQDKRLEDLLQDPRNFAIGVTWWNQSKQKCHVRRLYLQEPVALGSIFRIACLLVSHRAL